ncbi:MAG: hypothetical protein KGJ74_03065 [Betaproteobacteria bacterium]|jgi:hypothetical protein|nr:hypothetical protein [Betaproteobacteria bacterium]
MPEEAENPPSPKTVDTGFAPEIDLFCKHIDAISNVVVPMMMAFQHITKEIEDKLIKFEKSVCEIHEADGKRSILIPNDKFRDWKRQHRKLEHYQLSCTLLPRSLLVSLISQYDAYLGRLLRVIFTQKPAILNGSERHLTFESLNNFSSIEDAREHILEKEIESILRTSHADQFNWMEKKFSLPLTKNLAIWPNFIEITERRNLFVHTDGVVSSQYISTCRNHGYELPANLKEGGRLDVPQKYFENASDCIYEIGVKLGHVLWRKMLPEERKKADSHLLRITYDLIDTGRYQLAIRILEFIISGIKKFHSEEMELMFIVNLAQAYKWSGAPEKCASVMDLKDWSAKSEQFKLANAVLAEDWGQASIIMRRISKVGVVSEDNYRDWPLFREWRKQPKFLESYKIVFGKEFERKSEIKQEEATENQESKITPKRKRSPRSAPPRAKNTTNPASA